MTRRLVPWLLFAAFAFPSATIAQLSLNKTITAAPVKKKKGRPSKINGAHSVIYSTNPEADRAFLRDVLELPHVDVVDGWLIFGWPPAEVAVHPSDKNDVHEFLGGLLKASFFEIVDGGNYSN